MKSFKSTYVFAIVVVLLGVATYFEFQSTQEESQKKEEQTKALPFWEANQVSELRIVTEDREMHLVKKDSKWEIQSPIKDEADESTVTSMLSSMISDKLTKIEMESNSLNPAQFGIDEAKRFIEFIQDSTSKKKLIVSSKKTFDGKYYLKYADTSDLYLASSTWDQWIHRSVNELRNKKLLNEAEKIKKVSFVDGKNIMTLENKDSQWVLGEDVSFPLDMTKVNTLVSSLQNFRAADVVAEDQAKENLKKFKLQNPTLKIVLELEGDSNPLELNVSPLPKEAGDIYLYTNRKPFIYKTFKGVVEKWKVSRAELKKVEEKKEDKKEENKSEMKSTEQ